ncbi:MAG: hypothetical protein AAF725_13660, partial [Acidobacteriota bacterium]
GVGVPHSGLVVQLTREGQTTKLRLWTGPGAPLQIVNGGTATANLAAAPGQTLRLGVRVADHLVEVFVNGRRIDALSGDWLFDGLSSGFIELQPGYLGLTSVGGATGIFDNFKVQEYEPAP